MLLKKLQELFAQNICIYVTCSTIKCRSTPRQHTFTHNVIISGNVVFYI